eukprot:3206724-Pleurochrysis_carterae.AAC.1
MTHLCQLTRSNLLQNMEDNVTSLHLSRAVEMLVGSLMDGFSEPTDPCRSRFPKLHEPAKVLREARTHTVLIADIGA